MHCHSIKLPWKWVVEVLEPIHLCPLRYFEEYKVTTDKAKQEELLDQTEYYAKKKP